MTEKKPVLADEEIDKLLSMSSTQRDHWRPQEEEYQKLANTIEALEADLKSVKGLKRFIDPGILVTNHLVVGARPDDYRGNIYLRAFGQREGQIMVELGISQAERLARILPKVIDAARKAIQHRKLRKMYDARRRRGY